MKSIVLSAAVLLLCLPAPARQADTASGRVVRLDEVLVTATRTPIPLEDSPVRAELLTPADIGSANGSSAADLLSLAGDCFIRDQGTTGGLRTVSLRGGAPEQTLILIDGTRINSAENGLTDLSLISAENIDRIEIIHGGNSALFGADALAGVINILTRPAPEDPTASLRIGAGSFGRQEFSLDGGGRLEGIGMSAGFSQIRGRDDYQFDAGMSQNPAAALRTDADYLLRHLYFRSSCSPDPGTEVFFRSERYFADRGTPGPVLDPSVPPTARESDDNIVLSAGIRSATSSAGHFAAQADMNYGLEYWTPDPAQPLILFYNNRYYGVNVQYDILLPELQRLTIGSDVGEAILESSDFPSRIVRDSRAVYLSHEMHWDAARNVADRISIFESLRYDGISDGNDALTPRFGTNIRLLRDADIRCHATIGSSFRSPTLNDLYYPGASNPALKAERSTSVDAGVSARIDVAGEESGDVTWFSMRTTDRILFDPVLFIPVNLGEVDSRGVEVTCKGAFWSDALTLSLDYSYTAAENTGAGDPSAAGRQIIYQPKNLFTSRAVCRAGIAEIGMNYRIVGERYLDAANTSSLPAYHLVDAHLAMHVTGAGPHGIVVRGEGDNLFNTGYEVVRYYPMPGRSFRASVGYEF